MSFGTPCKQCEKRTHWCFSCGVESFYADYCSEKCLEESGKQLCPLCNGWGQHCGEDKDGNDIESPCDFKGWIENEING